jgi:uncharacterized protein
VRKRSSRSRAPSVQIEHWEQRSGLKPDRFGRREAAMPVEQWNEEGKIWADDHGLLNEEQIAKCARADEAETFRSPVPTRQVSNGEYMPILQTEEQQRVEARIKELAESSSKKLGISRRKFLASTGGMAAAFLAMNEVFGRFFDVSPVEMFEPEAFAATGVPRDLFVFDDQLHFVRGSSAGATVLRAIAQGPTTPGFTSNPFNPEGLGDEFGNPWGVWNPALVGLPMTPETFHIVQYIKDIYFDSQVTVGVLSNVTAFLVNISGEGAPRPSKSVQESRPFEILTAAQTAAGRNFINSVSGSTRCLAHGLLYVGKGNLEYIQYQIDQNQPDSWKGYNISFAAKVDTDPESLMTRWRLDDEGVAYPTYELISENYERLKEDRPGLNNICVHKGLAPGPPDVAERGHPSDVPKAATDWPNLNFIIYHSCIQPAFFDRQSLDEIRSGVLRNGVPDIKWTTEFAQLAEPFGNVYAEIGTTWASSIITFPTVAAHIMGQLLKFVGKKRIVFGSDSVWYGSPQWQIEALWRFEIPEEIRQQFGYPELDHDAKRRILGLNSAKLYGLAPGPVTESGGRDDDDDHRGSKKGKVRGGGRYHPVPADYASRMSADLKSLLEFPGSPPFIADNLSKMKEKYVAMGPEPSNTRYGWIRTRA